MGTDEYHETIARTQQEHSWRRFGLLAIADRDLNVALHGSTLRNEPAVQEVSKSLQAELHDAASGRHPDAPERLPVAHTLAAPA